MAAAFFAAYPAQDVVYVTPDGQCFTEKNKRFGVEHAKANFGGSLDQVTRKETEGESEAEKAEKEAAKAAKKAEKEAADAAKKAEKEAADAAKKAEKETKSKTT